MQTCGILRISSQWGSYCCFCVRALTGKFHEYPISTTSWFANKHVQYLSSTDDFHLPKCGRMCGRMLVTCVVPRCSSCALNPLPLSIDSITSSQKYPLSCLMGVAPHCEIHLTFSVIRLQGGARRLLAVDSVYYSTVHMSNESDDGI